MKTIQVNSIEDVREYIGDNGYRLELFVRAWDNLAVLRGLGYEAVIEYEVDGGYYQMYLEPEKLHRVNRRNDVWGIYSARARGYIDYRGVERAAESLKAEGVKPPHNFKKANKKIIDAWVSYVDALDARIAIAEAEAEKKQAEYLKRIKRAGELPNFDLKLNNNEQGGFLTYAPAADSRFSIDLCFEFGKNGYINQSARLNGVYNLEDVLKFVGGTGGVELAL